MRWYLLVSIVVSFCCLYESDAAGPDFDLSRFHAACRRKELGIAEGICELLRQTEARRHSGILKTTRNRLFSQIEHDKKKRESSNNSNDDEEMDFLRFG